MPTWRKSTHSGNSGCVDVWIHQRHDAVWVRNTKDPNATTVVFTHTEWQAFIDGVRAGEFEIT